MLKIILTILVITTTGCTVKIDPFNNQRVNPVKIVESNKPKVESKRCDKIEPHVPPDKTVYKNSNLNKKNKLLKKYIKELLKDIKRHNDKCTTSTGD